MLIKKAVIFNLGPKLRRANPYLLEYSSPRISNMHELSLTSNSSENSTPL